MIKTNYALLLLLLSAGFLGACSSSGQDSSTPLEQEPVAQEPVGADVPPDEDIEPDGQGDATAVLVDGNSLATYGCQNVVILNGFAYAACGTGIEVVDLDSFERNFVSQPADDITGDASLGVLFTQSGTTLRQFDLVNPMAPNPITTVDTNFAIFSGVSAANGILAVSGGSGGANTEIYTYDTISLSLVLPGIAAVDNQIGNPDVHVAASGDGATAFYSQDIGAAANWGLQIVELDSSGNVTAIPEAVVLTPGQFFVNFGLPFSPANIPIEGEFLDGRLYVAHFAAEGIEVIDTSDSNALSLIPLGYEPTNIATDGSQLFVVAVSRDIVDTIDPTTETVVDSISLPLQLPAGVAASETHIAVADRVLGLIVTSR